MSTMIYMNDDGGGDLTSFIYYVQGHTIDVDIIPHDEVELVILRNDIDMYRIFLAKLAKMKSKTIISRISRQLQILLSLSISTGRVTDISLKDAIDRMG